MTFPNEFTVYGSEEMLKPLILQLLAQYYANQGLENFGSNRPLPSYVKGKIYIKLYFKGKIQNTTEIHRVEKSFRLMQEDPSTIPLSRIKELGEKVKQKFDNFSFTTGHEAYTYNSPEHGFNRVWGYFLSLGEAKRLYEQMLDIANLSPDWKRFTKSIVVEPGDRFLETPNKLTQAGISIRAERERPIALMKFVKAVIKFPHIRTEVDLVDENGNVLDSLDFIKNLARAS